MDPLADVNDAFVSFGGDRAEEREREREREREKELLRRRKSAPDLVGRKQDARLRGMQAAPEVKGKKNEISPSFSASLLHPLLKWFSLVESLRRRWKRAVA